MEHPKPLTSLMPQSRRLYATVPLLLLLMLALQEGRHEVSSTAQHHPLHASRLHRRVKNMVFYMHDLPQGPKPTSVMVAAPNGKLRPPSKMGTTYIFDDKLTAGPDPNSMEVGRGQGLFALASLTNLDFLISFTAVLHHPAIYNGSTLSLHGSDRVLLPIREITVVGGTGFFRLARGYAALSTVKFVGLNAIVKFNLTLLLE